MFVFYKINSLISKNISVFYIFYKRAYPFKQNLGKSVLFPLSAIIYHKAYFT